MRKDMFKVIVERERSGSSSAEKYGYAKKKWANKFRPDPSFEVEEDDNNLPTKDSMKKIYGYDRKSLNENLNPLYRFMRTKIGQRWDDVWSEICAHVNSNSTVQKHVLDHARDMVEHNIVMINGEPWTQKRYGAGWEKFTTYSSFRNYNFAYVHPDTNILTRTPEHTPRQQKEHKLLFHLIDSKTQGHKIGGIWYVVDVAPLPPESELIVPDEILGTRFTVLGQTNDVLLGTMIGRFYEARLGWSGRKVHDNQSKWHTLYNEPFSRADKRLSLYGVTKKQMNHTELKRYGLTND